MLPDPLHPAIVHFPIVLVVIAPLVALGTIWAIRRGARSTRAWGMTTLVLGALVLSAWLATTTGQREEERVERVVAEQPIETHEEAAELFLYAAAAVLAVALVGFVRGTAGGIGRALGAAGALALVAVGWNVGRTGGELVYRHGAARAYMNAPGAPGAPAAPARDDDSEARRQVEEARAHYARILPLIRNLHNPPAASEMLAAADHLELAVRAGAGRDVVHADAPDILRQVRGTAELLARQPIGVPATTAPALATLQDMLDALTVRATSPDIVPAVFR